jgi:hypothetical protein
MAIVSIVETPEMMNTIILDSGGGTLYKYDYNGMKCIYKKTKHTSTEITAKMKTKQNLYEILNLNPVFLTIYAYVFDNDAHTNFLGFIFENLENYKSLFNICYEKQNIFETDEPFRQFLSQYLNALEFLFERNLCSHIEHGGNIMINNDDKTIKIIDPDEIGDTKFIGCNSGTPEEITAKQFESILQLKFILLCSEHHITPPTELGWSVKETLDEKNTDKIYKYVHDENDDIKLQSIQYTNIESIKRFWNIDIKGGHIPKKTFRKSSFDKYKYLKYKTKYLSKKMKIQSF